MECTLSNSGIATGLVIRAAQVSQSVDAFTKGNAYDITLSGSLVITGSVAFSSSEAFDFTVQGIRNLSQTNVLSYNSNTGTVGYVDASSFVPQPSVSPYETGSNCAIKPLEGSNIVGNTFWSSIGGGCDNTISVNANCTYIGGGESNCISSANNYSIIVGGLDNSTLFPCAFIGGGRYNQASNSHTFIGGGSYNTGSSEFNVIVGGTCNKASGIRGIIVGGQCNCVTNTDSIAVGGLSNCTTGEKSSIVGGAYNTASSIHSFIGGGCCNFVCHNESFIIGSNITSCAVCTTHVNNLNVGCTTQMQLRDPIGTGQAGMLTACDAGGGVAELYFHDGTTYKKVCLVP